MGWPVAEERPQRGEPPERTKQASAVVQAICPPDFRALVDVVSSLHSTKQAAHTKIPAAPGNGTAGKIDIAAFFKPHQIRAGSRKSVSTQDATIINSLKTSASCGVARVGWLMPAFAGSGHEGLFPRTTRETRCSRDQPPHERPGCHLTATSQAQASCRHRGQSAAWPPPQPHQPRRQPSPRSGSRHHPR